MAAAGIKLSKQGWKNKGLIAVVDEEDFEMANQYNWSADNHKHTFYAVSVIDGKKVYLHNFISGLKEADHVDRNGLNNQRSNLRGSTRQQNMMNKGKQKGEYASRFKGVSYDKRRNTWNARIEINGKKIYLGSYKIDTEAAIAYNNKAKELHPDFAVLNIINN